MTYRYTYKITCTKGRYKNKFYFGKHTTDNLYDGYKGSGKKLGDYYKKHPDDYIKEILAFYNTDEELDKAEYDLIHPWLNNTMCLNLMEGGTGGAQSIETRKKMSDAKKNKEPWNKGKTTSEEARRKQSEARRKYFEDPENRRKQSERRKGGIPWNKGKKCAQKSHNKGKHAVYHNPEKTRWHYEF